jgi:hypothetical protein
MPMLVGQVRPPQDMVEAARNSLLPATFTWLMAMTGGKAPTPAQLVAAAEVERHVCWQ